MSRADLFTRIKSAKRQYGPNQTDELALISLDESPYKAVWPVRIIQLFGGQRWLFGVVAFTQTPKLQRQRKFRKLQDEHEKEGK